MGLRLGTRKEPKLRVSSTSVRMALGAEVQRGGCVKQVTATHTGRTPARGGGCACAVFYPVKFIRFTTLVFGRYTLHPKSNAYRTREEPIQGAYGLPKDPTPKWQLPGAVSRRFRFLTALPPPLSLPLSQSGKRESECEQLGSKVLGGLVVAAVRFGLFRGKATNCH